MKLAVNSLIHGIIQTLAETMTLAEASGITSEQAFDVIAACAPMLKYRRPLYLNEADHDVTFTVALARKDMEVTPQLADRLGTAMPQGRTTLAKLIEGERQVMAPAIWRRYRPTCERIHHESGAVCWRLVGTGIWGMRSAIARPIIS
ncbi:MULTISPECIES: NAD-binding protein [unclassified Phaeobacter]|uniref:NAD-binding protein n=1 Tax=unclassified Phaeobacter TaxID=2621772 RepID=UPI003A886FEE